MQTMTQEQAMRVLLSNRRLTIETLLEIEDKQRQLVPFVLNPIQVDKIENSTWRDIYVKPGQVGATSIHVGDFIIDNITASGTVSVIISYDEFSAQRLLLKAKKFHQCLERRIPTIPKLDHKSATELSFIDKATNFYSSFYIFSARGYVLGRGETIHNLLMDEYAFWPEGTHETIFASAVQRVPLKAGTKVRIQCYSGDTEVLTRRGWIKFPDLDIYDDVITKDPHTNFAYYAKPSTLYHYDYTGDMIRLAGKRLDLLVTPEHKVWTKSRSSGYGSDYKFREAKTLTKSGALFDTSMKWFGDEPESFTIPGTEHKISMDTWVEFLGYFLSEGSLDSGYGVRIGQSVDSRHWFDMVASANKVAKCIGTEVIESSFKTAHSDMLVYIIRSKELHDYLSNFTLPKRMPYDARFLCTKYLMILVESFAKGDGSSNRNCLYNTSKELLDAFQEILLKLGYSTNLYSHKGKCGREWKTEYMLTWSDESNISFRHKEPEIVSYCGDVYCAEVPSHLLMVRRNGKAVWCGNSTANGEDSPFCEMYRAAKEGTVIGKSVYKPHFYPWFIHPEYVMYADDPFCLPEDAVDPLRDVQPDEVNLLRLLIDTYSFDEFTAMAKLRWRRYKKAEMASMRRTGDTAFIFEQEYPEDDESCFITAGNQAYDSDLISSKIRQCYPAPMHKTVTNPKTGTSVGVDVWYDVEDNVGYVLSIDPGKGKVSESVAHVWTFKEGYRDSEGRDIPPEFKHCATLAGFYDEWEMAEYCKELAKIYNEAVIAPEDNLDIVSHLRDWGNLYFREDPRSGKLTMAIGWQTNTSTKPYMITELSRHMDSITCHDIRFWSQCRNIRRHPYSKTGIIVVGADDHHDCGAIAIVCRSAMPVQRGYVGSAGWSDDWGR